MSLGDIPVFAFVGLVAGFLASASLIVMGRGRGWFWNLIIGLLGALLGGWLAEVPLQIITDNVDLGWPRLDPIVAPSVVNRVIVAFVGAVILLLSWPIFRRILFRR